MEKKIDKKRPPVVVVLGHVDHGKSSLLEAIREDFVITKKESGGITQHIGAYEIEKGKHKITFIDTPGHEAFSAMRQRGAHVADIAILVIDAGEGVKEQTKEAIKFIQKADIPMIVAFNKMDKPGSDPEKIKPQLSKEDVLVESYGGKVPSVNVSAKEKQGIEELLETILLVAEMEELKNDFSCLEGTVIESSLDPQRGVFATLLVGKGVLKPGDIIATRNSFAKVKDICNFKGNKIDKAVPSQPVIVLGFIKPPEVGGIFKQYNTEKEAEEYVKEKEEHLPLNQVLEVKEGKKVLNIILKTDVLGSKEVIEGILKNIPQEKVILRILKSEVGDITMADTQLAESGASKIFGFRVKADEKAKIVSKQKEIKINIFNVIYELIQEVRKAMTNILEPEIKRVEIGRIKITHLFKSGKQQIIGGKVLEGEITRNVKSEIQREEIIVGQGRIKGLQKDKQDLGKATKGQQIGLMFESEIQIVENDILLVFREDKTKSTL